jgi:hypothetical protein
MARRAVLGHRFVAVSNTFGLAGPRPSEFESPCFISGPARISSENVLSVQTYSAFTARRVAKLRLRSVGYLGIGITFEASNNELTGIFK